MDEPRVKWKELFGSAIIKFEQEFMGRGPDDVKAFVVRDLVVGPLKGCSAPAERQLAKTAEECRHGEAIATELDCARVATSSASK